MAQKTVPPLVRRQIKDYVRTLRAGGLPIKRVILFGSYAKGQPRPGSDIDVCIVSPQFTDSFSALQYLWRQKRKNHLDLEPIGLSPQDFRARTSLAREIRDTGIAVRV